EFCGDWKILGTARNGGKQQKLCFAYRAARPASFNPRLARLAAQLLLHAFYSSLLPHVITQCKKFRPAPFPSN
ncbi:hypothetical protein A2U01_0039409, partial [Trifolium medium]|nr:hypothetical protein [Trifolium medium]